MTETTPSASPERVRVGGPGALAQTMPHLLGYHPHESLVLVGLKGPRRAVAVSLRIDLAALADYPVQRLATPVRQARAQQAILLAYSEVPNAGDGLPWRAELERVSDALLGWRIPTSELLLVRDGRWWSYVCERPECCPAEGTPLPAEPPEVAVALAVEQGRVVLPDRSSLAATIAPVRDSAAEAVRAALSASTGASTAAVCLRVLQQVRDRFVDPRASWQPAEAATVLRGLADPDIRDEILLASLDPRDEATYRALRALAPHSPPEHAAAAYTLLGAAAYARGAGVLACTAFERALDADPDYRLAQLLFAAYSDQLAPPVLRRALRADLKSGSLPRS